MGGGEKEIGRSGMEGKKIVGGSGRGMFPPAPPPPPVLPPPLKGCGIECCCDNEI